MDKKQYNSLMDIAQEIADRYGADNNGLMNISDERKVVFFRTPYNSEMVKIVLTYDKIKEHFGYDADVNDGDCYSINRVFKSERNNDFREMCKKVC